MSSKYAMDNLTSAISSKTHAALPTVLQKLTAEERESIQKELDALPKDSRLPSARLCNLLNELNTQKGRRHQCMGCGIFIQNRHGFPFCAKCRYLLLKTKSVDFMQYQFAAEQKVTPQNTRWYCVSDETKEKIIPLLTPGIGLRHGDPRRKEVYSLLADERKKFSAIKRTKCDFCLICGEHTTSTTGLCRQCRKHFLQHGCFPVRRGKTSSLVNTQAKILPLIKVR